MINHVWSLLCGRCVVDRRTNNLSLIDQFDEIRPRKAGEDDNGDPIFQPITLNLVSVWCSRDEQREGQYRVRIFEEGEERFEGEPLKIELSSRGKGRTIIELLIEDPTPVLMEYVVELEHSGAFREVTRIPFQVLPMAES